MAPNDDPIATQEASPVFRQISEPNPHKLSSESEGQDEAVPSVRRLASNYLVELVRNADDATSRGAAKPLGLACQEELRTLCESELRLLQTTFRIANGQWNAPLVGEGLRSTQLCLAANSDALSLPCVNAMATAFLKTADTARNQEPNPTAPWQPLPPGAPLVQSDGRSGKQRHGHKMRRHNHDQDDSSDDPKGPPQGLEIYVINNNNGGDPAVGNGNAVDQWGHHDRHERHHHHHHGTHPLVWMLVLPFFCVGVFVSVKHAVAYIKKRRGDGLPFATQSHEYEPLKVPDSPSQ